MLNFFFVWLRPPFLEAHLTAVELITFFLARLNGSPSSATALNKLHTMLHDDGILMLLLNQVSALFMSINED